LRLTDPVIRAGQPLLQVPDGAIRERNHRRGAAAQRRLGLRRASPGRSPICDRRFPL
jgi:hypothetical protein